MNNSAGLENLRRGFSLGEAPCHELLLALLNDGEHEEAIIVALTGLSRNPLDHRTRLLFARVLNERGFTPFAVRELDHLISHLPANEMLRRLRTALAPSGDLSTTEDGEHTVAAAEFDLSDLGEMDDEPELPGRG